MAGPICLTNTHAVGIAHAASRALDRAPPPSRGGSLAASRRCRDVGRLPQRHQRRARHGGRRAAGARERGRRPGGGGLGRGRDRDELLRVQGRLGNGLAARRARRDRVRGGRVRPGELRFPRRAGRRRRARRRGARGRQPARRVAVRGGRRGLRHSRRRDRRAAPPEPVRGAGATGDLGLARTGTTGSHFSGDIFLGLSTGNPGACDAGLRRVLGRAARTRLDTLRFVPWGSMDAFFAAVVHATEEAVLDALVAERGHGRLPRPPLARAAARSPRRAAAASGAA